MKKILLLVAFLSFSGYIFSQGISVGPVVGFNISKVAFDIKGSNVDEYVKSKAGFQIGGMADIEIMEFVSVQPAIIVSKKGFSYDVEKLAKDNGGSADGYARERLMYVLIPIHIAGQYEIGPGKILAYVGPYFAYGISGKYKYDGTYTDAQGNKDSQNGDEKIKFKSKYPSNWGNDVWEYYSPLDIGVDFGIGFKMQGILAKFGYSMGLTNMTPKPETGATWDRSDYKAKNRVWQFTIAYLIGFGN